SDEQLSHAADIEMPRKFQREEILFTTCPVVVKHPSLHRGEQKYLLETEIQKIRFLAWDLIGPDMTVEKEFLLPEKTFFLRQLLNNIARGEYSHPLLPQEQPASEWTYEEFIETPGVYYTSVRVVVDAF